MVKQISVTKTQLIALLGSCGKLAVDVDLVLKTCTGALNRQTRLYDVTLSFVPSDPLPSYDIFELAELIGDL